MTVDHFERLGLERGGRLDAKELEAQYVERCRKVHPDLYGEDAIVDAAALNEAHRVLADRWQRYAYLAELWQRGVMDATKNLCPTFLAQAMALFEEAQAAQDSEAERADIEARVRHDLSSYAQRIETLLVGPEGAHDGAVLCHQARYLQRALERLVP
ncbi:MAG: hypothetical protein CMJ85_12425 [Planctomycetes bacterium]|nr:hypothetical protein [Planctomycetota bacterium]MDP6425099.1 hypothetical protein [Planctomycetota bacterium]